MRPVAESAMTLPRSLQPLLWVLACLALTIAPHAPHLPYWILAATVAIATWRVAAELSGWKMPKAAIRILGVVLAVGGVLASYRTVNGLEAGTALLTLMAGAKLL